MKILHISTRLILGGSQENTVLSCEGQLRRGHDVHLAFGPIFGPEGSMLETVRAITTRDDRSMTTHELPHMVRELSPLRDVRAYRECRRLIRSIQPDIVHTHSSKAGILGRAAAWKEGGRQGRLGVIHTIHGLPFHPYESKWRNAIYILSERWAARRCHRLVTVCDAMRDQAIAKGVGRRDQFTTVYSGMEIDPYLESEEHQEAIRAELGLEHDDFVIGTVARLAELKGHDDLIDALADRLRQHPTWKLLWVGDGWWRERLERRLRDERIQNHVVLTGLVQPERVPELISAMDVLVHPSYREGLPRTVPQALLAQKPVIAYAVDGAPEVCISYETGLLVDPGDLQSLTEAVQWMYDHPDERRTMGECGRMRCRTQFSAEKMVDDLEQVYTDVLNSMR